VIVIGAARSPIPSPAAPSPRPVINQQRANPNANSETDQRSGNDSARGTNVNHRRIVNRNINHLWIHGLNYVNRLTGGLLHVHLELRIRAQRAGSICLGAQSLNRVGDGRLVSGKCDADGSVIVDVLRHHGDDLREIHQRDERRIESRCLRSIGQRGAGEVGILDQPIINVENFLRIRAGGGDLSQQRIGIERHGS
jgi:hypothetical protein